MSSKVCSHCGCSDIDFDPARGDAVCTNCGSVLEDNIIVSEVTFQENALGGTSVLGQFVSSEGVTKSSTIGGSFHHGFGKESRQITLQNGRKKITQLGSQLKLNQHCLETAYNFYKMAVAKRLTRGRKITHVISACLYLVCRTEGTAHMLLDFSDILQVNVYELGKTYLKLTNELCINVPAIDPCILIPRFAHKLEFGDKTHDVSMTALRLVQRMKRDWMHVGRRPSGLCGAALLVASRLHDFSRTQRDVIKVVKVCDGTLRKRLTEFERTPSSKLKLDEFMEIDLEEEQDPPSFTEARWKDKLSKLEEMNKMSEVAGEIYTLTAEIDQALEKKSKWPSKDQDEETSQSDILLHNGDGASELSRTTEFLQVETFRQVGEDLGEEFLTNGSQYPPLGTTNYQREDHASPFTAQGSSLTLHKSHNVVSRKDKDRPSLPQLHIVPHSSEICHEPNPTAASLGLKETIEECMRITEPVEQCEEDGELDLSGIDDAELDKFILTEEEVKVKSEIWTKVNAVYLQEQKEKEEREAKEKAEGVQKPEPKKRRKVKKKQPIHANTAGEAIEKMLQEKKISNKINYDVLRDLNKVPDTMPTPNTPCSHSEHLASNQFRLKRAMNESEAEIAIPLKSLKEEVTNNVVVESGPVQYESLDDGRVLLAEEELEDEEEEHVSAAQMLGHGADPLEHAYDDEYD